MPGIEYSLASLLSQLRDLLRDRYKLDDGNFSVLKEIVQNADDAGARHLDFVLSDAGAPSADNPLLKGPALICINDGTFTRLDARALRSFGVTTKARQVGAIGRFGVGQKSVFHLCEAYFYMGRSGTDQELLADVVDPWATAMDGDKDCPLWNHFSPRDRQALLEILLPFLGDGGFFALYLPLRQQQHRRAPKGGIIQEHFPDVRRLASALGDLTELGCLLPQLAKVERITTRRIVSAGTPASILGTAARTALGNTLSRPDDSAPFTREFNADCEVSRSGSVVSAISAFGHERCVDDPDLIAMLKQGNWPHRTVDTMEGETLDVAEKGIPHGATTVIRVRGDRPHLRIGWAVFLPLGESTIEIPIQGDTIGWRVWLHGYMFPDSGRRGISVGTTGNLGAPSEETTEQDIRDAWNRRLIEAATMPSLLEAVARAVKASEASEGEHLVRALASSPLYQEHASAATADASLFWGPVIANETIRTCPVHLPSSYRLLPLPRPSEAEQIAAEPIVRAFIAAAQTRPDTAIGWIDSPRLSNRSSWDAWDVETISAALGALDPQRLRSPIVLAYLSRAAARLNGQSSAVAAPLLDLLRRCFRSAVLALGATVEHWRALVALCPRGAIFWSHGPTGILRELTQLEPATEVLILPNELRPSMDSDPPHLSLADARCVLMFLSHQLRADRPGSDLTRIIAEFVACITPPAVLADPELNALPLFRVWSARRGVHVCLEASRLNHLAGRGAAFRNKIGSPEAVARRIAAAIEASSLEDVLLIDDDAIANAMNIGVFDESLVAMLLLHPSVELVTDSASRHALLSTLIGTSPSSFGAPVKVESVRTDPDIRRALRYLIHGAEDRRGDEAPLLRQSNQASVGLDSKTLQALVESAGQAWRFIPEVFDRDLPGRWLDALDIRLPTPEMLVLLMRSAPGPWRETIGISLLPEGRTSLRRFLARQHADDLFAELQIHDTVDGEVVSSRAPGVYLEDSWPVPDALGSRARLIRRDDDVTTACAQARVFRAVWSPAEQISLCLDEAPGMLITELLEALAAAGLFAADLLLRLRQQAWLPTADGTWIRPLDVLALPEEVNDALRRMHSGGRRNFHAPTELRADVQRHPAFEKVKSLLALTDTDALMRAATALDEAATGAVNPLWLIPSGVALAEFLDCANRVEALGEDPAWRLVQLICRTMPGKAPDLVYRARSFRERPEKDRYVRLLSLLSRGSISDAAAFRLFEDYLRDAATAPDFASGILPRIRLLDGTGAWRPTSEIAANDRNLESRYQLHPRHRTVLPNRASSAPGTTATDGAEASPRNIPAAEVAQTPQKVVAYFRSWEGRVSGEAIGYFLACLGDQGQAIQQLAQAYLGGSITLEGARDKLIYELNNQPVGYQRKKIDQARWSIELVSTGDEIRVHSLAGTELLARVAGDVRAGIFVDEIPVPNERRPVRLRLRRFPTETQPDELHGALGESIITFLSAADVELDRPGFHKFWDSVRRGGLSEVESIRAHILDRLPVYIEALLGRRDDLFRPLCRKLDITEQRHREVTANKRLWGSRLEEAKNDYDGARSELQKFVENNVEAQQRLLSAVREKLAINQYPPEQALFELFQNADDATSDLPANVRQNVEAMPFEVELSSEPLVLRVRHHGRLINRGPSGTLLPEEPDRGHELDLKNMLVLHLSEKDEKSTGRFGLGFKSVHLLTSSPRVVSGDLSFEIIGGLLPRHVPSNDSPGRSTVFELPLDRSDADRALSRYRTCGGLLPVFARAIRRVSLSAGSKRTSTWRPDRIDGSPHVEVGNAIPLDPAGAGAPLRLLVLRDAGTGPQPTIAFRLQSGMVGSFPDCVPELWCTTPTREQWGMGFCINGPFSLDVGRGQLARDSHDNLQCFAMLGDLLAAGLRGLHQAFEQNASATAEVLGRPSGGRPATDVQREFWESLFERLTRFSPADSGTDRFALIRAMHAGGHGLSALIAGSRVLPTGLPDDHAVLTSASAVRFILDDVASTSEVLRCLADLEWLPRDAGGGAAISRRIHDGLRRVGVDLTRDLPRAKELSFDAIIEKGLPEGRVIDAALGRKVWRLHRTLTDIPIAEARLRRALTRCRFPTRQATSARLPAEILIGASFGPIVDQLDRKRGSDLRDELLRSRFAPPSHVLHDSYGGDVHALETFLLGRERLTVGDGAELARWAVGAGQDQRTSVIRYLAEGELLSAVRAELKKLGGIPWCRTDADLQRLGTSLTRTQLDELRIHLLADQFAIQPILPTLDDDDDDGDGPARPLQVVADPTAVLRRISDWWRRSGRAWSHKHNTRVYSCWDNPLPLAEALVAAEDHVQRDAWLTMMCLSACQRFGRQQPEQHAQFLRRLRLEGAPHYWAIVCAEPGDTHPDTWMGFLDQWLDSRVDEDQYRLWLSLFPTLYQLHRHAEVYQRVLSRAHERSPTNFSPEILFSPRADPDLSGGGSQFDAAPLGPALGIGAVWILRELLRLRAIPVRPHLIAHCYVPRRETRQFLQRLGATDLDDQPTATHGERSRRIHTFLASVLADDPTFGAAFDLPIYLVATDERARGEAGIEELL